MQPPTEPSIATATIAALRGDEDDLYRRHHRDLERAVARVVNATPELVEDACQTAWAILLRNQPDRVSIFAWLRVVAVHEAFRLSATERRDARLERLHPDDGDWQDITADPRSLDDSVQAREALRILAALPERQRNDLTLVVAGHSYNEIAELTGPRTYTNVILSWRCRLWLDARSHRR
jgi:DNA-directed RNA polymerase specialized sigma24 family protein